MKKAGLLNEIEMMRKLNHKNILRLYEVYESQSSIYMVLDLLTGGELLKTIKENYKVFTDNERARILKTILEAIEHMHSKGIMHRDLKPENILLKNSNSYDNLLIVDLGLASYINANPKDIVFKKCGTPGFVAPEILEYKESDEKFYNEKCDIFSVGVIFSLLFNF